ncbi:hypothetical protein BDQ17DRAFT_1425930 [Cyathus striatus]|nr:hypothetical protein BDQ17DRAFT_1425930 [Cyathus striatus]
MTGAPNYSPEDVELLLNVMEVLVPLGLKGWANVKCTYNNQAIDLVHPHRSAKSLELKFKQLVKMMKPTGDAECPPHILKAHKINQAMNEKESTWDIDNEDIVDTVEATGLSDREGARVLASATGSKVSKKAESQFIAHCTAAGVHTGSSSQSHSCVASQGLLVNISTALDPTILKAHHEEHLVQALQANQIF